MRQILLQAIYLRHLILLTLTSINLCYTYHMKWDVVKVRRWLGGKLIGSLYMREIVCKTILLLPSENIASVCAKVWFISSPEDAWAFTFRGADIKDRSLIFLSDALLRQDENQISYTL